MRKFLFDILWCSSATPSPDRVKKLQSQAVPSSDIITVTCTPVQKGWMHAKRATRINKECYLTSSIGLVNPPKRHQLQLHCHFQLHYQPTANKSQSLSMNGQSAITLQSQSQGISPLQRSVRPWPVQSCVFISPAVQFLLSSYTICLLRAPFPQNQWCVLGLLFRTSRTAQ